MTVLKDKLWLFLTVLVIAGIMFYLYKSKKNKESGYTNSGNPDEKTAYEICMEDCDWNEETCGVICGSGGEKINRLTGTKPKLRAAISRPKCKKVMLVGDTIKTVWVYCDQINSK